MSNNPGKRGKPAPWEKRAAEHRERALEAYRLAKRPAYAEWSKDRSEALKSLIAEAGSTSSLDSGWLKAEKATQKRLRAWEKANPNPMSWEDYTRLEAEFDAQYVPKDFS